MKKLLCETYGSWLAGDDHQLTPQGNMRPPFEKNHDRMGTVGLEETSSRADTKVMCILRFEHKA